MKLSDLLEPFDSQDGTDLDEYRSIVKMLIAHPDGTKEEVAKWAYMGGISCIVELLEALGRTDVIEYLMKELTERAAAEGVDETEIQ